MDILYVFRSIIALVIVIWLVNVILKYLSQYSNKQSKSIEIIERISVSKVSSLAIVRIVHQYYLMSFSEDDIDVLREFDDEEVKEIEKILNQQEEAKPLENIKNINLKEVKEKYSNFFN